jgi:hypothetical protein
MTAAEGFERMDVSTAIDDDPKFRALARRHPDLFAVAFTAYIGMMARSWRQGERLTAEEAWPSLLPYDPAAVVALCDVLLLDDATRIPAAAWARHFGAADERRRRGRERWARYDEHRPAKTPPAPPRTDSQTDRQSSRGTHAVPTRDPRGDTNGSGEPSDGVLPEPPGLPSKEEAGRILAEIRAGHAPTALP